ncbi:Decaprenyl diphosphate synthase-like protein [Cunninghamella echinulata]|nr:Decaprenyl diphosphate synthase-like protein [Cunninghamella echinulata]
MGITATTSIQEQDPLSTLHQRRRTSLQVIATTDTLTLSSSPSPPTSNTAATTKEITSSFHSLTTIRLNHILSSTSHILCILALYTIHFIYIIYIAQKTLRRNIAHRYHQFVLKYHDHQSIPSLLLSSSPVEEVEEEKKKKQQGKLLNLIHQDKSKLSKIPKHLAITISDEMVFERTQEDWDRIIHDICQTSCWAFEMGMKELSIFDASGILKNMAVDIYKQQSITLHNWCQNKKKKFKFSILSMDDVQSEITQVSQKVYKHITSNKMTIDTINVQLVDEFMQETMSDPELMIIYDGLPHNYVSISGYFPWHIRLTEFLNVTSYHQLNYTLFSLCLYRFSKVEQRFGH